LSSHNTLDPPSEMKAGRQERACADWTGVGWTSAVTTNKSWATRHQARPLQDPRTAASKMHQMGTQRGAALGGRCWKQKARCRPAGWIDCGPMASVLEKLRNRPPGRKQLTGGPSAARSEVEEAHGSRLAVHKSTSSPQSDHCISAAAEA
jgi:hypothetical protein